MMMMMMMMLLYHKHAQISGAMRQLLRAAQLDTPRALLCPATDSTILRVATAAATRAVLSLNTSAAGRWDVDSI